MRADSYTDVEKENIDKWRDSTWGEEISLEYGKALRGYQNVSGQYRVFGSNGPVGWTDKPLTEGPGVILGRKGAYRGVQYSPDPFFVIDTAYYVVPKTPFDMRWLYYAIQYYKLGEIDDGSPVPSTTRAAVYVRDLQVPPLVVQKSISNVLGSLDDKIALNQETSQTLEQMAQAIFKSWFVDFDPVRAKMSGRQPELMDVDTAALFPDILEEAEPGLAMIPQGWKIISLYETSVYVNGAAFKAGDFSTDGGGLPIIKIAELKQGVTAQTKFTEKDFQPKYSIDSGDVCYSWSGSPETSLDVFRWLGGPGWLNQHIFKLECSSQKQKLFAYYLLKQMRPILVQTAMDKQTTGLGHVTVADMKRIKVVYPDPAVLKIFYEKVKPLYEQCELLGMQCSALSQFRDALLPKLLSGKIVVAED